MKTWIIALPFLCATSAAMAQAQPDAMMPSAEPAERAAAQTRPPAMPAAPTAKDDAATMHESRAAEAKAPAAAKTKRRAVRHGSRSLPKGDVRHCLDLKTRTEVIRCSETRKRK